MSTFVEFLRRADYRGIAENRHLAKTDFERYLVCRAELILGHGAVDVAAWRFEHPFYGAFLRIQARVFARERVAEAVLDLGRLRGLPDSDYLHGEFHLILGYVHHLLHEFKQGSRHHRLAREFYLKAEMKAQAATALYNLCIGARHLNARDLLAGYLAELKEIVEHVDVPSLLSLTLQFEGYAQIEAEAYEAAVASFERMLALTQRDERARESGAAAWPLAYLYLKTGRDERLDELPREGLLPEHASALGELFAMRDCGLVTRDGAKRLTRAWKRRLDPIPYFYLVDLVLDALVRAQDYEGVVQIAVAARREIVQKQHATSLLDFRFAEALGRGRLGEAERARALLAAFRADSHALPARLARAERLAAELGSVRARVLVLDPSKHEARIGGERHSLVDKPRLFQLLLTLVESRKPVALGELFYRLYGLDYHPLRHERRLGSLLDRARKLMGDAGAIRRAESTVALGEGWEASLETPRSAELTLQWRRQRLASAIGGAGRPLAISELESSFDVSRRTLQLDLDHLVDTGAVRTNGGTRGRKYFLEDTHAKADAVSRYSS